MYEYAYADLRLIAGSRYRLLGLTDWRFSWELCIVLLKEKKMQSKRMFSLVDEDIQSPYKIVRDIWFLCVFLPLS